MRVKEDFFFRVVTSNEDIFFLDLQQYYYISSKEHKNLPSIISFFKRKKFEYIDKQDISKIILKKDDNFIEKFYNNLP